MSHQESYTSVTHPDGRVLTKNYLEGIAALERNNWEEAFGILKNEPENSPAHGMALVNAGFSLLQMERYGEADEFFGEADRVFSKQGCEHPPSLIQLQRNKAECLARQGHPIKAIEKFEGIADEIERLKRDHQRYSSEIDIQFAHTLNSHGGTLVRLLNPRQAATFFTRARNIYRNSSSSDDTGHAEVLTNLALAVMQIGGGNEASIALQEALPIAKSAGNASQIHRIKIATIQLEPSLLEEDPYQVLDEAIAHALSNEHHTTAFTRLCIKATLAFREKLFQLAIDSIKTALALETKLSPSNPEPARIRFYLARSLDNLGDRANEVIDVLLEGSAIYYELLSRDITTGDFHELSNSMHDHFRYLSRKLIDAGRTEDALTSFEFGRAISYAVEAHNQGRAAISHANPFINYSSNVDCSFIRGQQAMLAEDEVILTLTILPPDIVAFVVRQNVIQLVTLPLPTNQDEAQLFIDDLQMIPTRLEAKTGVRAIPEQIITLCKVLAEELGQSTIRALLPSAVLHKVPWRSVFRHCGVNWDQLRFAIGFSLVVYQAEKPVVITNCCALGYGNTATRDLNDEAAAFSGVFGGQGENIPNCSPTDTAHALMRNSVVLISCHGEMLAANGVAQKTPVLQLKGGWAKIDQFLPSSISSYLVILSACNSGAYEVDWGDYPTGIAPEVIRRGGRLCVTARFTIDAAFTADFMSQFAIELVSGREPMAAFSSAMARMENGGADIWQNIACLELLGCVLKLYSC